jgi:antagonist of KipI
MLDNESRKRFLSCEFTIRNESDRMGFRLKGAALNVREKFELVSSAVDFGTIQLLPDGQLIILMADHQTTGGYPRIAHAISRDRSRLAQLGAGDLLRFEIVTIEEAEKLALEFERDLNFLRLARSLR